jgi:hypothetical protein
MSNRWHQVYPPGREDYRGERILEVRTTDDGFEMRCRFRWTGKTIRVKKVRQTWQEMLDVSCRSRQVQDFITEMLLNKGDPGEYQPADPAFNEKYPRLHAFMTVTRVQKTPGEWVPRRTASVSVFLHSGGLGASLNDRGQNRSLFVTVDTFLSIWDALEAMLAADRPAWRYSEPFEPEKHTSTRKKKA